MPPPVDVGDNASDENAGGSTVRVPLLSTAPVEAEIVTSVWELTGCAAIVKLAEMAPSGTVTLAGTEAAAESELASVTAIPPGGAGPPSVTLLVVIEEPPVTVATAILMLKRPAGN